MQGADGLLLFLKVLLDQPHLLCFLLSAHWSLVSLGEMMNPLVRYLSCGVDRADQLLPVWNRSMFENNSEDTDLSSDLVSFSLKSSDVFTSKPTDLDL